MGRYREGSAVLIRAPCYPSLAEEISSVDDALPFARRAVGGKAPGTLGLAGLGGKVLIAPPADQDPIVLEAILQAFKEEGVDATVAPVYDIVGVDPEEVPLRSAAEGWREVFWLKENAAILGKENEYLTSAESAEVAAPAMSRYLKDHPRYTAVFAGVGGSWAGKMGEMGAKWKGNWVYSSREALVSGAYRFPVDILDLVERKIVGLIPRTSDVRITDPTGTEVRFSVNQEEARRWAQGAWKPGHLLLHPFLATCKGSMSELVCARANGVIAGTSNHFGFYPHMRVTLRDGVIEGIEGGGEFGRLLRELMARTKDISYPGFPRPGYLYLSELALGTCPKSCRDRERLFNTRFLFPNFEERSRAGVFHWGFGLEGADPSVLKFGAENGLAVEHGWHVHTYFGTYEVRLRDTGEWITIVDRGHITALDAPDVKALAARHGDLGDLLREEWIPAIPGINYPGDYMRDYGRDPVSWVWKETQGLLPTTIGVP